MKRRSELRCRPLGYRTIKAVDQRVRCHAPETDEKVSDELEVGVCATRLDLVKLECSFKSTIRSKTRKNMLNFINLARHIQGGPMFNIIVIIYFVQLYRYESPNIIR